MAESHELLRAKLSLFSNGRQLVSLADETGSHASKIISIASKLIDEVTGKLSNSSERLNA